jgi:hypothetical protein
MSHGVSEMMKPLRLRRSGFDGFALKSWHSTASGELNAKRAKTGLTIKDMKEEQAGMSVLARQPER